MSKFTSFFKKLCTETLAKPDDTIAERWQLVGFFQAFFLFSILGIPLIAFTREIREAVLWSPYWFVMLLCTVGWLFVFKFTLKFWLRLTQNIGFVFVMDVERTNAVKANKSGGS